MTNKLLLAPHSPFLRVYVRGILCTLALLTGLTACAGYSVTGGPGSNRPPALQSSIVSPSELAALRSVYVTPIVLGERVSLGTKDFSDHYDLLLELALRELSPVQVAVSGIRVPSPVPANAKGQKSPEKQVVRVVRENISQRAQFVQAAQAQGVQSILELRVHRFEERQGGRLGAESGAVISFSAELRSGVAGSDELWRASYVFEDQAVTDNLLRIRDHFGENSQGGWGTAERALQIGIEMAMQDLQKSIRSARLQAR